MTSLKVDERTSRIAGRVSQVVLSLTHVALAVIIFYRSYVLKQSDGEFADVQLVFAFSMIANLLGALYFGAYFPVLSAQRLVKLYLVTVVLLFVTLSLWLGLPKLEEWDSTLLPITLGPAIMVVIYYWVSKLGEKRLEKEMNE